MSNDLGEVFVCLSVLEEKTFELYQDLATKVQDSFVKESFQTIAQESLKHSSLLKDSSEIFGKVSANEQKCEKGLGEVWKYVIDLQGFIEKKDSLNFDELIDLSKRLAVIEHSLVEEYNILVKLRTIQYMGKEISISYGVDVEKIQETLESIISDEESHRIILDEINEHLEKMDKTQLKSKIVKFPTLLKR